MSSKSAKGSRYPGPTAHRMRLRAESMAKFNKKHKRNVGEQPVYTDEDSRFECPVQKKKRLLRNARRAHEQQQSA